MLEQDEVEFEEENVIRQVNSGPNLGKLNDSQT